MACQLDETDMPPDLRESSNLMQPLFGRMPEGTPDEITPLELLERAEELFELDGVRRVLVCKDPHMADQVNALHRLFCNSLELALFPQGRPQVDESKTGVDARRKLLDRDTTWGM